MKLSGDYTFDAPIEQVWDALFDPDVLAASLPGCEKLERAGDSLVGDLNIKIGPVKGTFSGTVDFSDIDHPHGFHMAIDGKGKQGFVKATADVRLAEDGGKTRLEYDSDSKVGGKLASVGQRLVQASAKAIAKQSLTSLDAVLSQMKSQEQERDQSPPVAADLAPAPGNDIAKPADAAGQDATPRPAEVAAKPRPKPMPQVSASSFAAGVAKEVAKDIVPPWARVAIAIALVGLLVWLAVALL